MLRPTVGAILALVVVVLGDLVHALIVSGRQRRRHDSAARPARLPRPGTRVVTREPGGATIELVVLGDDANADDRNAVW